MSEEPKIKTDYNVEELLAALEFKCEGCKKHLSEIADAGFISYCPYCRKPNHTKCLEFFGCQNPDCSDYANRKKDA